PARRRARAARPRIAQEVNATETRARRFERFAGTGIDAPNDALAGPADLGRTAGVKARSAVRNVARRVDAALVTRREAPRTRDAAPRSGGSARTRAAGFASGARFAAAASA